MSDWVPLDIVQTLQRLTVENWLASSSVRNMIEDEVVLPGWGTLELSEKNPLEHLRISQLYLVALQLGLAQTEGV